MNYHSNKNSVLWIYFIALLCFAILRNVSFLYLILPPIFALAIVLRSNFVVKNKSILFIYIIFIGWTCFVALFSPIYNPDPDVIYQVPRLFFSILTPLVFCFVADQKKAADGAIIIFVACYAIAVFTYIFQINFGAIEWFSDEPMERGTVLRYATNLGSGNIYGIGIGSALLASLLFIKRDVVKFTIVTIILLGAILSMQKATIVNVILAFVLYFLVLKKWPSFMMIFSSIVMLIITYVFYIYFPSSVLSIYILEFINNGFGIDVLGDGSLRRDTVLSEENLWERFAGIHVENIFEQHPEMLISLIGVGITGAGGGMGLPQYLQAHSTYWDIFFMGGITYLLIVIALFSAVQFALWRNKDFMSRFWFFSNIVIFVNMFAASALIFHPILSLPLWLSVGWAMRVTNAKLR